MNFSQKWKPGAEKKWLHLLAGITWSGVGILLGQYAVKWLIPVHWKLVIPLATSGIILSAAIYAFGFSRLAKKNSLRIHHLEADKPCLFAFQEWKSYPLVIFMISLGIFLRKYSPIPKPYLAILYLGLGGSLFIASLHYYQHVWQMRAFDSIHIGDD